MLILPDRHIPRSKILLPMADRYWRTPSQAQKKDQFGNENRTTFHVRARLNDGHIVWDGCFDDRADFDAFLWAVVSGTIIHERELWRLPTPWWHPDLFEDVWYDFAVNRFLTTTNAANQTDTLPLDWNPGSNFIDTIASGGSGGAASSSNGGSCTGGSGAGWSRQTNVNLLPGANATYRLSAGGTAVSVGTGSANGNAGADCWYNGTTLAGASVGAKGGLAGNGGTFGTISGVAGGAAASGIGSSKTSGGASGNANNSSGISTATGGGGAGGSTGDGVASGAATNGVSNGGAGDASVGGAGGTGGGAGGNGTEYDASHGSGGGGGGKATVGAGAGGLYGAGGGANSVTTGTATSGAGNQALIVQNYAPFIPLAGGVAPLTMPPRRYVVIGY